MHVLLGKDIAASDPASADSAGSESHLASLSTGVSWSYVFWLRRRLPVRGVEAACFRSLPGYYPHRTIMNPKTKHVVVTGGFDDIRSSHLRFFEEASKFGEVTVLLWSDDAIRASGGKAPCLSLAERLYFLNAIRFITSVQPCDELLALKSMPSVGSALAEIWIDLPGQLNSDRHAFCRRRGVDYHVLSQDQLGGFPPGGSPPPSSGRKKVVVTG